MAATESHGGIVHFDISPKNINKVVQATEAVVGGVSDNIARLLSLVKKTTMADQQEWFDKIKGWQTCWPLNPYPAEGQSHLIKPQYLIEELSKLAANRIHETVITTGVGQYQMWTAQQFRWQYPRTMITSGGLGTMGYGFPAAIGAKIS